MKKETMIFNGSAAYESPQINVFTFETEGVLCGSEGQIGGGDGSDAGDYEDGGTIGGDDGWGI